MTSITAAAGLMVILAGVGGVTAAGAADCADERAAYHATPSLPLAASYIACIEQPMEIATDGGVWVPRNPLIGAGPTPVPPSFDQLQQYLRWLQEAYAINDQDWSAAIQMSQQTPGQYDVLVNDNVLIVPRSVLPEVDARHDIDIYQLNRANPGYLDDLQLEHMENLDLGGIR